MRRRFNYTGRKRIPQDSVVLEIHDGDDGKQSFDGEIDLDGLGLPANAAVIVEAYHRTDRKRYNFGTVAATSPPDDTSLSELARISKLRFRVKVVDQSATRGRILASASQIVPMSQDDEGTQVKSSSILPVRHDRDLNRKVWRLEFDESSGPELWFNNEIPGIEKVSREDSDFFCLVYPVVVREVLTHLTFVSGVANVEDPEQKWKSDWLAFARGIAGVEPPSVLDPDDNEFDPLEVMRWIEDTVNGFCRRYSDKWSEYLKDRG